jgi:hypothetical protein
MSFDPHASVAFVDFALVAIAIIVSLYGLIARRFNLLALGVVAVAAAWMNSAIVNLIVRRLPELSVVTLFLFILEFALVFIWMKAATT